MQASKLFIILVLMLVSSAGWAYGGGSSSSTKACTKPKFSDFTPAENADVPAGASFAFTASANTNPNSIKVTVKGLPVDLSITPKKTGNFEVTGVLPATIKGDYARIAIVGEAPNNCHGNAGWLVKVSD